MDTITSIRSFPPDTPREALEREIAIRIQHGALSATLEEREGEILLVVVRPGPKMLMAALKAEPSNPLPLNASATLGAKAAVESAEEAAPLGALSAKFESNGNAGAIGEDRTGGPSYGAYQIATRTGTMASFLAFLERARPDFAARLAAAGGEAAARAKAPGFVAAWKGLAADPSFLSAQHGFVRLTHYDPFVKRVETDLRILVNRRSSALQNVAWSTAVQHGPANSIFRNALQPNDAANRRDDANIIRAVYAERSKVEKYFVNSTAAVQQAVKARFARELTDALAMLG